METKTLGNPELRSVKKILSYIQKNGAGKYVTLTSVAIGTGIGSLHAREAINFLASLGAVSCVESDAGTMLITSGALTNEI